LIGMGHSPHNSKRAKKKVLGMSDDDLTWAVEASAAQIALMWMVHQWETDKLNKPLDVQIINFSSHALSEMCAAYPILQNATEELRWLTYFKGLIAADTHPPDQMLSAIYAVRRRRPGSTAKPSSKLATELDELSEIDRTSDADALAAIDRALSKATYSGHL
jgi:hypothetical protein